MTGNSEKQRNISGANRELLALAFYFPNIFAGLASNNIARTKIKEM
jgi:hypothetical protein